MFSVECTRWYPLGSALLGEVLVCLGGLWAIIGMLGRVVCVYLSLEILPDAFNETDCFSME